MPKVKPTLSLIVLSSLMLGAPALARTEAKVKARTALLEVIDQDGRGKARTTRLTLALAEDRGPSQVEIDDGQTHYKVSIISRFAGPSAAVVMLDLQRTAASKNPKRRTSTKVNINARVALARRAELGRIDRSDGGYLLLALTLK
jgi:hypothetical protein